MTKQEMIDYGVSIGWLTPEKAEQLKNDFPDIVYCKECKRRGLYDCPVHIGIGCDGDDTPDNWYCADGERR